MTEITGRPVVNDLITLTKAVAKTDGPCTAQRIRRPGQAVTPKKEDGR